MFREEKLAMSLQSECRYLTTGIWRSLSDYDPRQTSTSPASRLTRLSRSFTQFGNSKSRDVKPLAQYGQFKLSVSATVLGSGWHRILVASTSIF